MEQELEALFARYAALRYVLAPMPDARCDVIKATAAYIGKGVGSPETIVGRIIANMGHYDPYYEKQIVLRAIKHYRGFAVVGSRERERASRIVRRYDRPCKYQCRCRDPRCLYAHPRPVRCEPVLRLPEIEELYAAMCV
jgi:hypothetical protein